MYFVDGLANLFHDVGDPGLSHRFRLAQLMVELSSCTDFEDDVYVGFVVKEAIHPDNVGVVKIGLNFEFSNELLCDFLFFEEFLLDFLECTGEACISLHRFSSYLLYKRYLTVLAGSKLFDLSEVVDCDRSLLAHRALTKRLAFA